jgi:hypothetical protein
VSVGGIAIIYSLWIQDTLNLFPSVKCSCWEILHVVLVKACNNGSALMEIKPNVSNISWNFCELLYSNTALQAGRLRVRFPRCHWNFLLIHSFRTHCDPGVDSSSNRNEYQEYLLGGKDGRCVVLTLPPSWVEYLEILEGSPPGILKACPGLYRDCFTYLTF